MVKYITFYEFDCKHHSSHVYYIQYDNNEEILKTIHKYIKYAERYNLLNTDCSYFDIDTKTLLSYEEIKNQPKINTVRSYISFEIINGIMSNPFDSKLFHSQMPIMFKHSDITKLNEDDVAYLLDRLFCQGQISNYFTK